MSADDILFAPVYVAVPIHEAERRKATLLNDPEWIDRYMRGGRDELREMTSLHAIIAGCYAEWREKMLHGSF